MLSFSPKTFFLNKCFVLFNNYKTISIAGKIIWSQEMARFIPIGKWQIWLVIFKLFVFCYSARPMQNITSKSLSEAIIFASTNPQYDNRWFIELQVQYMKIPSSEHGENMLCTEIVFDFRSNFCTQYVLLMFCKKKSFWQRFNCTVCQSIK